MDDPKIFSGTKATFTFEGSEIVRSFSSPFTWTVETEEPVTITVPARPVAKILIHRLHADGSVTVTPYPIRTSLAVKFWVGIIDACFWLERHTDWNLVRIWAWAIDRGNAAAIRARSK
jgi:hypothetical protein